MPYLVDSSSLMILIKNMEERKATKLMQDSKILDLTYYEAGNMLWKHSGLHKYVSKQDLANLTDLTKDVLRKLERISAESDDLPRILEIANREKLTFYDSSYLYIAVAKGLSLVTDDFKLAKASHKYITTKTASEMV
ncbi:MAG: type II toxin-antitoxin system VapC family toxin [Thaumarchaeota archaeon]|nr:type II toxin-antitoxin system VapC family toxin [Nitrososphaerota archaeon]